MFLKLLLLFTLVPVIELWLLIRVGAMIGAEYTILIIILTGILGAYLVKRQGLGLFRKINLELNEGQFPGDAILEGVTLFAGGLLLVTPGFITDFTGFIIVIPYTRKLIVSIIKKYLEKRFGPSTRIEPL
ncbi:FxsA family protein [bacterium]|nr:FxsA family protein [bacterium]